MIGIYYYIVSCLIPNCSFTYRPNRRYCATHYERIKRNGDPDLIKNPQDGRTSHPLYLIYAKMKDRCLSPSNKAYPYYGGRGIKVCDSWLGPYGFTQFVKDVGQRPSLKHGIDRINNDGNYEPSNIRWSTMHEQTRNRRSNALYTINGKTQCLMDWALELKVPYKKLLSRRHRGWSIDRMFSDVMEHQR